MQGMAQDETAQWEEKTYRNSEIPIFKRTAEEGKSTKEIGQAPSKNARTQKKISKRVLSQKPKEQNDLRWDGIRSSVSSVRPQKPWKVHVNKRIFSSKEKQRSNSQLSSNFFLLHGITDFTCSWNRNWTKTQKSVRIKQTSSSKKNGVPSH